MDGCVEIGRDTTRMIENNDNDNDLILGVRQYRLLRLIIL